MNLQLQPLSYLPSYQLRTDAFVPQIPKEHFHCQLEMPQLSLCLFRLSQGQTCTLPLYARASLISTQGSQRPWPKVIWTSRKTLPLPSFPSQCVPRWSEDKRIIGSSLKCVGGVTKCNLRNWKYQVEKENPLGRPWATCTVELGECVDLLQLHQFSLP